MYTVMGIQLPTHRVIPLQNRDQKTQVMESGSAVLGSILKVVVFLKHSLKLTACKHLCTL